MLSWNTILNLPRYLFDNYSLCCPLPPSNSHHQDYETFLVGDPNLNHPKPSFAAGILGRGTTQIIVFQTGVRFHDLSIPGSLCMQRILSKDIPSIRKNIKTRLGPKISVSTCITNVFVFYWKRGVFFKIGHAFNCIKFSLMKKNKKKSEGTGVESKALANGL